eukprot:5728237-Heterocapsa_arctica.AAC.1
MRVEGEHRSSSQRWRQKPARKTASSGTWKPDGRKSCRGKCATSDISEPGRPAGPMGKASNSAA